MGTLYPICDGLGAAFSGGSRECSFETKLFHFHGEFSEKSEKNNKLSGKINKSTPFINLNPLSRNPGYPPDFQYWHTFIITSPTTFVAFSFRLGISNIAVSDETTYFQASQLGLHCLLYVTFEKLMNGCIGAVSSELSVYKVQMFKAFNQRITHAHQL